MSESATEVLHESSKHEVPTVASTSSTRALVCSPPAGPIASMAEAALCPSKEGFAWFAVRGPWGLGRVQRVARGVCLRQRGL